MVKGMSETTTAAAQPPPGASPPGQRGRLFSAMRYRNFRFYWLGMILSVIAMSMEFVSLSWLVLTITNAPVAIGVTGLVNTSPIIALNLVGGAVADRVNRQRLLLVVQAIALTLYLVLATLVTTGVVAFWQVLAFAFLIGSARAFDSPTRMALLPQLVEREDIPSAVALSNVVWQLPRMVGPAVAGLLIAAVGVGAALYLCGLAAAGAFCLFGAMRLRSAVTASSGNLAETIREGLGFIRGNAIIATLILMTFFNSVFGMSFTLMEAVFARDVLHVGSEGFGFMEAAGGIGSIGGVVVAATLARAGRRGAQAILGAVAFGVVLVGFAVSPWYPLSLALLVLCGLFSQLYMTNILTVLQMSVPDAMRGRVMGLFGMTYSLIPLGGTIAGAIAQAASAPVAIALDGVLVVLGAVVVWGKVRAVRQLN
jgi:predicted MFS family arabinose efflux permease